MRTLIAIDSSATAAHVLESVRPRLSEANAVVELLTVLDSSELKETDAAPMATYEFTPAAADSGVSLQIPAVETRIVEDRTQAIERAEQETTTRLNALGRDHLPGVAFTVRVVAADRAADAILDEAQRFEANVIAMGTHGRSGLRRVLMGSVAEDVLRRAPVPLLLVRSVA